MATDSSLGIQLITYLLLPGLSALLGAWAGANTALARFKKERSFDRRLDWLERSIKSIGEFRNAIHNLLDDSRLGNWHALTGDTERTIQSNRQLMHQLYESEMYASAEAVRLAVALRQHLHALPDVEPPAPSSPSKPEAQLRNEIRSDIEATYREVEPALAKLVEALISDVRGHLGLAPIR